MRTSGDGDDGAGLRRRGGQHARDGAGGGGHVLLLRKIVHALLCFLALSSPSLWRENGWAQKSRRNGRRERRSGGAAAAFGDTGSSIRGERRMDMRPHSLPRSLPDIFRCSSFFCSIAPRPLSTLSPPSIETRKQAPLPLKSTKSTRVSLKQLLVCPLRRGVGS